MQTVKELNKDIVKLTSTINEKYPELIKYISEMPNTLSTDKNPEVERENLLNYKESLKNLIGKYSEEHPPEQ